jgi:hypothetical protein
MTSARLFPAEMPPCSSTSSLAMLGRALVSDRIISARSNVTPAFDQGGEILRDPGDLFLGRGAGEHLRHERPGSRRSLTSTGKKASFSSSGSTAAREAASMVPTRICPESSSARY